MYSIEGIQTKLVEIDESDAEAVVNLRNNPQYNKYLFQSPVTVEEQKNWIKKNKLKGDNVNFKVVDHSGNFKGTISVYDIKAGRGEFGRYIVTNPIYAIEAEYLFLKFSFEVLRLESIFCQTNYENTGVWKQHGQFGFGFVEHKNVTVGTSNEVTVKAVVQNITQEEYKNFDYSSIVGLLKKIRG